MKINKKAFTLIELLAVIIILGVLMLIAIPSVTEYIGNSRKKTYLSTAHGYIGATVVKVNNLDLPISDTDTTYYVPIRYINLEKGGKSPYGNWENAYVVVTTDGTKFDYYWTSIDEDDNVVKLTYGNNLTTNSIERAESIDLTVGVGGRSKIIIFADDGSIDQTVDATVTIADGSSLNEGTLAASTNISCFEYFIPDEAGLIDWLWASDIAQAEQWLQNDYGLSVSNVLNTVIILNYYKYQDDGTTPCPTDVAIPNKIEDKNVTWIEYNAFTSFVSEGSSNKEYGSITRLSNEPKPMLAPGREYFDGKLTSVVLPKNLLVIESDAFCDNQISSLVLPNTIRYIGNGTFYRNKITNLIIPDSIFSIGEYAFRNNNISTLTIPSSLRIISEMAFAWNNITSVSIPEGIEVIEYGAFLTNNITSVNLPSSLITLCNFAFESSVTITPLTPTWQSVCCNCSM